MNANALETAIKLANLTDKSAADVSLGFRQKVRIKQPKTAYKSSDLAKMFGRTAYGKIDETLRTVPGLDWVRLELVSSDGLDFALDETIDGLNELRGKGAFTDQAVDGLLALGFVEMELWEQHGLPAAPDEAACAVALGQLDLKRFWDELKLKIDQRVDGADISIAEIKAIVAGAEIKAIVAGAE